MLCKSKSSPNGEAPVILFFYFLIGILLAQESNLLDNYQRWNLFIACCLLLTFRRIGFYVNYVALWLTTLLIKFIQQAVSNTTVEADMIISRSRPVVSTAAPLGARLHNGTLSVLVFTIYLSQSKGWWILLSDISLLNGMRVTTDSMEK